MSVIREKQQFTLSFDLIDEDGELNVILAGHAPFSTTSVKGKAPVGLTETWATPTGTATTPAYGTATTITTTDGAIIDQKESLAFGGTTFTWSGTTAFTYSTNTGVVTITTDGGTSTTTTTKLAKGCVNVPIDTTTGQPSATNAALSTSGTWHFQVVLKDASSEFGSEPISIHVAEKLE